MNTRVSLSYVVVTPARNEENNIERLITCMVNQTCLPLRWIIVSDGSTDQTDQIVAKYAMDFNWIELLRMPERRDRNFGAKVTCFSAGYARIQDLSHDIIGNVDADVSFDKAYMEFLIDKFNEDKRLGVAGTPFVEDGGYSSIADSFEGGRHVAGGCQMFRKECYQEIGGYVPNKAGGIDWIAVTTARMMGWTTQSFPQKVFYHHRALGTGDSNKTRSNFNYGRKDYYLGNHPLWEAFRILYRFTKRPYVLGGLVTLSGYLWALFTRMDRPISNELMAFHRNEEMRKLKAILWQLIRHGNTKRYELKF